MTDFPKKMGYEQFMNFTGRDSAGRDSIACPKAVCTNRLSVIDVETADLVGCSRIGSLGSAGKAAWRTFWASDVTIPPTNSLSRRAHSLQLATLAAF